MTLPAPPRLDPASTALFLDIDGTLAEFERLPEEVGPDPRRNALLAALVQAFGGRVALISGRALSDVDRISARTVTPASGVHGLEVRHADGRLETAPAHPNIGRARERLKSIVRAHPTLVLEDKGLGLVLHYRTAPELCEVARAEVATLAEDLGLAVQLGHMMAEVRTPGRTKGDAVKAFLHQPPFQGRAPVYVGDDLTDEDAFQAVAENGGWGVLVGPTRASAACYVLPDVEGVLQWLDAAAPARIGA